MRISKLSTGVLIGVLAAALIMPTAAIAAGQFVTIVGPNNRPAQVSAAGQLLTTGAQFGNMVSARTEVQRLGCGQAYTGGVLLTVPATQALIITDIAWALEGLGDLASGPGEAFLGRSCPSLSEADILARVTFNEPRPIASGQTIHQSFRNGIPVPSGTRLFAAATISTAGWVQIWGYYVPASAVPVGTASVASSKDGFQLGRR